MCPRIYQLCAVCRPTRDSAAVARKARVIRILFAAAVGLFVLSLLWPTLPQELALVRGAVLMTLGLLLAIGLLLRAHLPQMALTGWARSRRESSRRRP